MRRATIGTGLVNRLAAAGVAVALAAAAPSPAPGAGHDQPPRALASNGAVVEMPEIGGLDCAGMEAALRRADLSDYRGGQLLWPGHPDWPIFEYEDRLARRFYADCVLRDHVLDDPAPTFSNGFEIE